ncbi:hypothetical protein JG687_00003770 [Phytophthora cactorum]|uniref:Uncharacterized protein n=1 Tax=Phytophthora cactorum TaxID=29920 RepID=A0A8T1UQM1_9STRA|nr:hypothetical protein JG687_00003770 [Phytophthora cactorum]
MWKEVNKNYIVGEKRFTNSGQNKNDFRNFANGGEIRRQLSHIDREIVAAVGTSIKRLEEVQDLLLHERQSLMDKLSSYSH